MKGIVFNLLEEVVTREYGEEAWDRLLEMVGTDGAYTSLGSYGDEQLVQLVVAASKLLDQPADDVIRWFARRALPLLAERYPEFFSPHTTTRSFLLTLNSIIHPEVRKIYPGADVPVFEFDSGSPDVLAMEYSSPRKLCAFAEGLIQGAAEHYHEDAEIQQTACMHKGDPSCLFRISFRQRVGARYRRD